MKLVERVEALVRLRTVIAIARVVGVVDVPAVRLSVAAAGVEVAAVGQIAGGDRRTGELEVDVDRMREVADLGEVERAVVDADVIEDAVEVFRRTCAGAAAEG